MGASDLTDLARRAVACEVWRWMPGMRYLTFDAGHRYACRVNESGVLGQCIDPLPDLTDDATIGCLLALVREAFGDPELVAAADIYDPRRPSRWRAESFDARGRWRASFWGATEAEALVSALEHAP